MRSRARLTTTLALCASVAGSLLVAARPAGAATAFATSAWTTYHGNNARTGVASTQPKLTPLRHVWANALDGSAVYGQPLVAGGRVFVATEDDNVYALNAHNGKVLWHRNIGQPLRNVTTNTGCGNIDPLGITSTPVIGTSGSTVYVVGEVSHGGAPPVAHRLVGFNVRTGAVNISFNADPKLPAGESRIHLQQRAALAVANGRVYVAYGGLAGDCGLYHGWVVGVAENGTSPKLQFDTTPQSTGGAIWQAGGGPSVDAAGNVYVTTGNPNSGGAAPWAEAVVKLGPKLTTPPLAVFNDSAATGDEDLGTGDAMLLPGKQVFAVGKTDVGFLLHQSGLTRVAPISGTVCGSDPDGGGAFDQATDSVYVPCRNGGIQQVNLSTHAVGWHAGTANGAPIVVNGKLWALAYNGGTLEQLNARTGAVLQSIAVGAQVPTFASPAAADGLILVGTMAGVRAFDGPAGPPPSTA
ncbi:MAG: PQQ-binding-like beta-propeller repeat protein [Acidimicrobiaceae bacterium]|nr:PQQ-binding-like beta-propeller repeat protein [Acidimicrobiaceae bacterium]